MAKNNSPKVEEKAEEIETAGTPKEETPIEAVVETPIQEEAEQVDEYKLVCIMNEAAKQSEEQESL